MRGLIPARIPVHKTRKIQLNSHLQELRLIWIRYDSQKEYIKNLFQTPDLDAFYQAQTLPEVVL